MYIRRTKTDNINRLSGAFPAVLLVGARQTGKTTLLKTLFPEHRYVSLELASTAELAEREPARFFSEFPAPLIIDEVQYAPGLLRHLKSEIEARRHSMGQYILTGSQKFQLMAGVSESLAGRCALLSLETLNAAEVRSTFTAPLSEAEKLTLLVRGGYPELWRNPALPDRDFYSSYVASYLERDVRQIINIGNLRDFERFVRACAARSGQLLNKTELSRDVGVSQGTVAAWISVLEASEVIHLLEPYHANVTTRIIKSPKLYFADTGLLCFLLGLDRASLLRSPYLGAVWETFIFSELRKNTSRPDPLRRLFFYRDQRGREIDFIRERAAGELDLIEAKWSEMPALGDLGKLLEVREILQNAGYRVPSTLIAARPAHPFPLEASIAVVDGFDLPAEN